MIDGHRPEVSRRTALLRAPLRRPDRSGRRLRVSLPQCRSPRTGGPLRLLGDLAPRWPDNRQLAAVRAHLLELAGQQREAAEQYRIAAAGTTSRAEDRR